eukprot:CAMPEP_0201531304 /NCGR_PEP_ID=MMETSP0161_2-20130828/47211_1 /ASSEMBLY_ACC=CAM_ASM_000251 /TAXON_ID=180227 /ORGANISM="Neoparamoeba aestuarina, Strain SoJaBio B1-5/56/2" /LENGTH=233 /DNA_ID=CAMNT_0047934121 /DNA_START=69 /DNA_END=767 /DNA_ORIENTATION=+
MGERKVLNKYYPPDFDPEILPRNKKPKDQQIKVRTMLPMSIQCNTCGEYLYKGKKFNAKKETCIGETYLGIEIYRFYIRCVNCSQEITFKTDPKRADYECEHGASRNFEPWRDENDTKEEMRRKREEEDEDSMKALENKTIDNRREMDILDGLDEMKSLKARRENITFEQLLEANLSKQIEPEEEVGEDGLSERDRREMREAFQEQRDKILRLEDGESEDKKNKKRKQMEEPE